MATHSLMPYRKQLVPKMIDAVHKSIDEAGKHLGLPDDFITELKNINREHAFEIHLKNGKSFQAYRVQHNDKRGPYKGGIRFHKDVNLDEIQALATLMSLKTAAVNIPMGGGKGGVVVDPRALTASELEELSRQYVLHLHEHIGPGKDVPAPDVNTDSKIIDWMVDEFSKLTGDDTKASFTGKSIKNGGSLGRTAATGRGGVIALAELLKLEGDNDRKLTIAIQGFGNVGSYFGTVAQEAKPNWRLVAVSDSEAGIRSANGLNATQLQKFKEDRGRFKSYDQTDIAVISNEDLLAMDVDVLVLAGLENSLTATNMKKVQAKYIVEMANGPINSDAYEYLSNHGKIIMPDIIANAGGVIVSYLEWLQNNERTHWDEAKVNKKLSDLMQKAVRDMHKYATNHDVTFKQAAFAMAIKRLTE